MTRYDQAAEERASHIEMHVAPERGLTGCGCRACCWEMAKYDIKESPMSEHAVKFPDARKTVVRRYIMNEYPCGCHIIRDSAGAHFIMACPLHNAATQLLEALQSLVNAIPQSEIDIMRECIGNTNAAVINHWRSNAIFAIAAATGKDN